METNILQKLGLNENEVLVYEELLRGGKQKASQISKTTPLKRGLIYKTLEDLEKRGLIIREDEEGAISVFTPIHPNVLKGMAENKIADAKKIKENIDSELGSLISMYNLANNKPGVEFYEGIEGIKKVLNDTLTSSETICAYSDVEAIDKYISKINFIYVKKRKKLNIKKKAIVIKSPFSKKFLENYYSEITENRFIEKDSFTFGSLLQIYDNKVSYTTLSMESMVGIIIQDKNIYKMQKAIFMNTWNNASPQF